VSCVRPLDGYRARGGKVIIVPRGDRAPRDATTRTAMSIPCQKCIGCRMESARQWGIRCLHEKKMWPDNSYVTLTYSDSNLPPGGTLCLRDVQLFMKRLRKSRGASKSNPIRFFLGGEYGEGNARPHYHALLFNCGFRDKLLLGTNKRGENLYTSAELSSLWSVDGVTLGFCTIGDVTFDSAVYCAKYALKKVTGDRASEHYCVYDENGQCFDRRPEFAVMSRNPGIGGTYFDKYGSEVVSLDSVVINGREVRPPRYYDIRAQQKLVVHSDSAVLCRCQVCINKRKRKRMQVLNRLDNTVERLRVKEKLMLLAAEKKERTL
jgi:hypothetical protein